MQYHNYIDNKQMNFLNWVLGNQKDKLTHSEKNTINEYVGKPKTHRGYNNHSIVQKELNDIRGRFGKEYKSLKY